MDRQKIIIVVSLVLIVIVIGLFIYYHYSSDSNSSHDKIKKYKKKIFSPRVTDIKLNSPFSDEPHFQAVMGLTKKLPRGFQLQEFFFIMLYKKYFERDDVYSMCDDKDIDQTGMLASKVLRNGIKGDFVEAGSWRGGMGMYLKAIMKEKEGNGRKLYLMDTFSHFPEPKLGETDKMVHPVTKFLYEKYYPVEKIEKRFKELDLMDEDVVFVKGEFEKTIPKIEKKIEKIALLRIDSDYYDSVKYVLESFYDKVSKGGAIIIDDYHNTAVDCKKAVDEFRKQRKIKELLIDKIGGAVYWIKD
jgi:O-methyltransferase